jgi:OOP family OmpA-OmpF porin
MISPKISAYEGGATMNKKVLVGLVLMISFSFVMAAQVMAAEVLTKTEEKEVTVWKEKFVKNVDNFIIYFDSSSSTNDMLAGTNKTRIQFAKDFLMRTNENLPDLGFNSGLYMYTPFTPIYSVSEYNKMRFEKGIESLPDTGKGPTLIQESLGKLDPILSQLSGRTAVIIFFDGLYNYFRAYDRPLTMARKLSEKYDVFFYIIDMEKGNRGDEVLQSIASVNQWSRVIPVEQIMSPAGSLGILYVMTPYAIEQTVFMTKVVGMKTDNILFDFDSTEIRPEFNDELDALGEFMKSHPEGVLALSGFSDNVGKEEYNTRLSRRRAEAIANYMVINHDIEESRILTYWYGSLAPVASNDTLEGQAMNRRVEATVIKLTE